MAAGDHPGADPRIDLVLDEHHDVRGGLMAVVLADHALAGRRIVGRPDAGGEQQQRVVERVGAQHDEIGGLLDLLAAAPVDIDDAAYLLGGLVVNQLLDIGLGAQLEFRILPQRRQHADERARLGVGFAAEIFAMAAILAAADRQSLGIDIGVARIRRRRREGMIAETLRRLAEDQPGLRHDQRLVVILVLARALERVAARDRLAAQVAGLAEVPHSRSKCS